MRTVTWECSVFSPLSEEDVAREKRWALEALMQFHAQGDQPPNGCGNGHTLALTTASSRLTLAGQQVQGGYQRDHSGRCVQTRRACIITIPDRCDEDFTGSISRPRQGAWGWVFTCYPIGVYTPLALTVALP